MTAIHAKFKRFFKRSKDISVYVDKNQLEIRGRNSGYKLTFDDETFRNTANKMISFCDDDFYSKKVELVFEPTFSDVILPKKATVGSACFDIFSPCDFRINPNERILVDSGIRFKIPRGYEIHVYNRSGMALTTGVVFVNGVGIIDEDYRGNLKFPFINLSMDTMVFRRGDRIAQISLRRTLNVDLRIGKVDIKTERSDGGFGSTGK